MARRYYLCPLPQQGIVQLSKEVSHHLARVMRAQVGESILLFDGQGHECQAQLLTIQGQMVQAEITQHLASGKQARVQLQVAVALPKGSRVQWLFEHGTELGIGAFRPIHSQRSQRKKGDDRERWQRILIAAAGQCDRAFVPELHPSRSLGDLLADPKLPAERYLAHDEGPALSAAQSEKTILLVGPEGGFSPEEIALAQEHGFVPRSLGATTLRTETAVMAGAVLLLQG